MTTPWTNMSQNNNGSHLAGIHPEHWAKQLLLDTHIAHAFCRPACRYVLRAESAHPISHSVRASDLQLNAPINAPSCVSVRLLTAFSVSMFLDVFCFSRSNVVRRETSPCRTIHSPAGSGTATAPRCLRRFSPGHLCAGSQGRDWVYDSKYISIHVIVNEPLLHRTYTWVWSDLSVLLAGRRLLHLGRRGSRQNNVDIST